MLETLVNVTKSKVNWIIDKNLSLRVYRLKLKLNIDKTKAMVIMISTPVLNNSCITGSMSIDVVLEITLALSLTTQHPSRII